MVSLNLADTFVTFLALLGPQKVLLSFARLARALDVRSLRLVAMATAVTAAIVGTLCAITAPWLATFFHISPGALALAAGIVFFVYAVGLVLGIHFDPAEAPAKALPDDNGDDGAHETDPVAPDQKRLPRCCCRSWSARSRSPPTSKCRCPPTTGAHGGSSRERSRLSRASTRCAP